MLLADGGAELRDLVRGRSLLREWTRVLPRYAELQIALIGKEREVLATGTPDHRLHLLAGLVSRILDDHAVIRASGSDRLSREDERWIRAAVPRVAERAAELEALLIGPTVDHDDLHDANALRRRGHTVIFDWGDACFTHPFLSLTIALRFAARRTGLRESDPAIRRLRDAYLEPFEPFASAARLRRGASIGRRLGMVTRALSWYRTVTLSGGPPEMGRESLAAWLRQLPIAFPPRRGR